jgi:hypothetical protein
VAEVEDSSIEELQQRVRDLKAQLERYRAAAQDTLEQVDWCIGYLTAQKLTGPAATLSRNREHLRTDLLGRAEQPLPEPRTESGTDRTSRQ